MAKNLVYDIKDRPQFGKLIVFAIQQLLAIMAATHDAYRERAEIVINALRNKVISFPFDVPDNDGFLVFTPMTNERIRKEFKLKKGERVLITIQKER